MAKKKTQTLEDALVPKSEQPYAVPENWVWVKLGQIIELISGRDVSVALCNNEKKGIPYILGASNLVDNTFHIERWIECPEVIANKGDVLLSVKGTIGKVYLQKEPEINLSRQIMALRPATMLKNYFLLNFLNIKSEELAENGNGLIPGISRKTILNLCFPLPPLAEQRRIVARIESLFEKLDHARELVQTALDSFETRKAAILHKAFTGELTAQWRTEHGVGMDSWEDKPLGELTNIKSSKRIFAEEYQSEGIPFFRSSEIVDLYDEGITTPQYFISENRYKEIRGEVSLPQPGDLLVTSVGTIGKTWIVDDRKFYYKDGNLTLVEKSDHLSNYYLQAFISSMLFKHQIYDTVAGSAYNALTIVKFKKIIIPRPSLPEQIEIVRVLDSLLDKEQKAKEQLEPVLDHIDLMKKSILARAFRGELGTNDPSEESALGLLEEILK